MPELEQQLIALGKQLEWPPTPAIRLTTVWGGGAQRRWGGAFGTTSGRSWALAAAAVLAGGCWATYAPPGVTRDLRLTSATSPRLSGI